MKDKPAVYFLAATDCTHADDRQPHVLLTNGKGADQLVVFLEGDGFEEEFEGLSEQSPQHHSPEFFAVQTYLVGKVQEIHSRTNDLAKTTQEIRRSHKEIGNSLKKDNKTRYHATFIPSNGDIFHIGPNDKHKKFPWGEASQTFGYEEKVTTPGVSSKSLFATPPSSPSAPPPQHEPGSSPNDIPDGPKPSVPLIPQKDDELKWKDVLFVPGPGIEKKRNILKGFYKHWGGDQILGELDKIRETNGNWHEGTARFKVRTKMLEKVNEYIAKGSLQVWEPKHIASVEPIKPITSVAPAVITSTSVDKPPAIAMILKPEERQKIEVLLPRVISARDEKGQLILNPEKLGEYEKSTPTLAEQLGKQAGTFLPIDPEGYDLIEAIDKGATKRLFFENQAILASLQKRIIELEASTQPKSKSLFG